jgi:hypothetical protein
MATIMINQLLEFLKSYNFVVAFEQNYEWCDKHVIAKKIFVKVILRQTEPIEVPFLFELSIRIQLLL